MSAVIFFTQRQAVFANDTQIGYFIFNLCRFLRKYGYLCGDNYRCHMEEQIVKTPREIGRVVAAYFKQNRITYDQVATRLGFASRQVVSNQLAGKRFGRATAAKYSTAYGFNELFLLTGKGELLHENHDELTRLKREIDELHKINRVQAETIRNLTQRQNP